jgi:PEP-CTERM motif
MVSVSHPLSRSFNHHHPIRNRAEGLRLRFREVAAAAILAAGIPLTASASSYTQQTEFNVGSPGAFFVDATNDQGTLEYQAYSAQFAYTVSLANSTNFGAPATLSTATGFFYSNAVTDGSVSVGTTSGPAYWSGATGTVPATPLALPAGGGFTTGVATAISPTGNQIVGFAEGNGTPPLIWSRSGTTYSTASALGTLAGLPTSTYSYIPTATDGTEQAGTVFNTGTDKPFYGIYWNSGGTAINLGSDPANIGSVTTMAIYGVSGSTVVGAEVSNPGGVTVATAVKITVSGSSASGIALSDNNGGGNGGGAYALSTNGSDIVGYEYNSATDTYTAVVWNSNGTETDLASITGVADIGSLQATSIDSSGNVYGYEITTSGNLEALEWVVATPEPSSLALLAVGAGMLLQRRGRSHLAKITS